MDETLKRRLVGAAVLALIAIVIVPMLLDGPDWQQADDEPQVTTSRNAEGERVVSVSLNGTAPVASRNQQANRGGGSPAATSRVPVSRNSSTGNSPSSPSESSRGRQAAGAASTASANASASANRSRVAESSRGANSRSNNSTAERSAVNSGAQRSGAASRPQTSDRPAAPDSSSRSGWVVQLATFASEENANRLVDKLRAGGWSAWIEPMTSRTGRQLNQVRVGPERSKAKANSSAEQLASKYKLKPQVLEIR